MEAGRNCFYTQQRAPFVMWFQSNNTIAYNIPRCSFVCEICHLIQITVLLLLSVTRVRRNRREEPIQELERAVSLIDMFLRARDSRRERDSTVLTNINIQNQGFVLLKRNRNVKHRL